MVIAFHVGGWHWLVVIGVNVGCHRLMGRTGCGFCNCVEKHMSVYFPECFSVLYHLRYSVSGVRGCSCSCLHVIWVWMVRVVQSFGAYWQQLSSLLVYASLVASTAASESLHSPCCFPFHSLECFLHSLFLLYSLVAYQCAMHKTHCSTFCFAHLVML